MGQRDNLQTAVLQIHEAGIDATKWPVAMRSWTSLLDGVCAQMVVVDLPSLRCLTLQSVGLPPAALHRYAEHYAPMSPRLSYAQRLKPGALLMDHQFINAAAMDRHPFYTEFMAPWDTKYILGGVVEKAAGHLVVASVQRSPKHPPTSAVTSLMSALLPHVQLAHDMNRRLGSLSDRQRALEGALDCLVDGALVLAPTGAVLHANAAAQEIIRRGNGLGLRNGALSFRSVDVSAKFDKALAAIGSLPDLDTTMAGHADFTIERAPPEPPLAISLRPLPREMVAPTIGGVAASVLMFIHDPLARVSITTSLLRETFGLTPAEADMAAALCGGVSADGYARARGLSRNTIYTHLRHIKEKTGSTRLAELIRKLNDAQATRVRPKL